MKVKVTGGGSMRGLVSYLTREKTGEPRGRFISSSEVTPENFMRGVAQVRALRPDLSKVVAHFSLNLPPGERRDDEQWRAMVDHFLAEMGLSGHVFLAHEHEENGGHQHVHIAALTIDDAGKRWADGRSAIRAMKIAEGMEEKFDLQKTKTLGEFRAETGKRKQAVSDGAARQFARQFARTGSVPIRTESAVQRAIRERKKKEAAKRGEQQTANHGAHPAPSGSDAIRRDAADGGGGANHSTGPARHSAGIGGGSKADQQNTKIFTGGNVMSKSNSNGDLSKSGNAILHLEVALTRIREAAASGADLRDGDRNYGAANDFANVRRYLNVAGDVSILPGANDAETRFRVAMLSKNGVHEFTLADVSEGLRDTLRAQLAQQRALDAAPERQAAKAYVTKALEDTELWLKTAHEPDLSAALIRMGEQYDVISDFDTADPSDPLRFTVRGKDGKEQKFTSADFPGSKQARLVGLLGPYLALDGEGATFSDIEERRIGHGSIGFGRPGQPKMEITPVRPAGRAPDPAPPTLGGRMVAQKDANGAYLLRWNFPNNSTIKPAFRYEPGDFKILILNAPNEKNTKALFDLAIEKNLLSEGVTITGSTQFQIAAVNEAIRRGIPVRNTDELSPEARRIAEEQRAKEQQATAAEQNAITSGFMAAAAARSAPDPKPEAGEPDAPDADGNDDDQRDADAPRRTAGRMR